MKLWHDRIEIVPADSREDSDVDPRHPEVVAVYTARRSSRDSNPPWRFEGSGVLTSHDRVLSAAHLLEGADVGEISVQLGADVRDGLGQAVEVVSVRTRGDLALLTLNRDLDVLTARFAEPRQVEEGDSWRIVGYGTNWPNGSGISEIRRFADLSGVRIRPVAPASDQFVLADPNRLTDTCEGDSGGPLYLRRGDELLLAGITSGRFGGDDLHVLCGPGGVYTRVDRFLDWIRANSG